MTRRASSSASSRSAARSGWTCDRLRPSEAREREPALAPTVRLALEAPDDHSVDPRLVLAALARACASAGRARARARARGARRARWRAARDEAAPRGGSARVVGVTLEDGERAARRAGRAGGGPVERADRRACPLRRACRCARSRGRSCACATPPGRGCCGGSCASRAATWSRAGTAATCSARPSRSGASSWRPTAGGVYELLRDAHELVPGVSELEIEELSVGLRPGTPDNAPVIGRGALEGLRLGDRPPPQRHPARAAHRRARRRRARRAGRVLGCGGPAPVRLCARSLRARRPHPAIPPRAEVVM